MRHVPAAMHEPQLEAPGKVSPVEPQHHRIVCGALLRLDQDVEQSAACLLIDGHIASGGRGQRQGLAGCCAPDPLVGCNEQPSSCQGQHHAWQLLAAPMSCSPCKHGDGAQVAPSRQIVHAIGERLWRVLDAAAGGPYLRVGGVRGHARSMNKGCGSQRQRQARHCHRCEAAHGCHSTNQPMAVFAASLSKVGLSTQLLHATLVSTSRKLSVASCTPLRWPVAVAPPSGLRCCTA